MLRLPTPAHMPCERCGASVAAADTAAHACDDERRLAYELFGLRHEIAPFDEQLTRWLASAEGRFEQFYAVHTRPSL